MALGRPIHIPPARKKVASLMRATRFLMPTLRDAPADAQAMSHQLLVRAGFVRQIGAGLYSYLPLGWRVHRAGRADHPRGDGSRSAGRRC